MIKLPIEIRNRKAGDRMTLKGMSGTKKLKDIFIDIKVPLQERETWPVVTDKNGWILWLPGLKKSVNMKALIFSKVIIYYSHIIGNDLLGGQNYETGY